MKIVFYNVGTEGRALSSRVRDLVLNGDPFAKSFAHWVEAHRDKHHSDGSSMAACVEEELESQLAIALEESS